MINKHALRELVREKLDESVLELNNALAGRGLDVIEPVLERVSSGHGLPHWYPNLKESHTLPNLDGKSVGSVIEMLYLAVLETKILNNSDIPKLRINPAKGVDLPDLDLGIKSPSTNYATSEPFFSAYERLLGSRHDCIVLLTNYQQAKRTPPLRLRIDNAKYLYHTQLADKHLCEVAKSKRTLLLNIGESETKKVFRFLAYINQQDWRARHLLRLVNAMSSEQNLTEQSEEIRVIKADYESTNTRREEEDKEPITAHDLSCFIELTKITPTYIGIINAVDNWVIETFEDAGRYPNDNEWQRLKDGPLNGEIGMSLALQWRYNFRTIFVE